jgi:regulatory protein
MYYICSKEFEFMVTKDHAREIPEWVLSKMQYFCAYEERCIQDVKTKLQTFHLQEDVYDNIINKLIKDDYLDEERYAKLFAGGKFRINHWGKNKIYSALQQKGLPELFILEGLNEIDPDEYITALRLLISKKSLEVEGPDFSKKIKKLANFAISRGFEPNIVWDVLNFRD